MARDRPEPRPGAETDPRFPSGRWVGFWLQRHMPGRQYMSFDLAFADGRVSGVGADCIGDFAFSGHYDLANGTLVLLKQYRGAHLVEYEGRNEDDGQWVWGVWTIRGMDQGGFHLWPDGEDDPTQRHLKREQDLPTRHSKRRIRLEPVGSPR